MCTGDVRRDRLELGRDGRHGGGQISIQLGADSRYLRDGSTWQEMTAVVYTKLGEGSSRVNSRMPTIVTTGILRCWTGSDGSGRRETHHPRQTGLRLPRDGASAAQWPPCAGRTWRRRATRRRIDLSPPRPTLPPCDLQVVSVGKQDPWTYRAGSISSPRPRGSAARAAGSPA